MSPPAVAAAATTAVAFAGTVYLLLLALFGALGVGLYLLQWYQGWRDGRAGQGERGPDRGPGDQDGHHGRGIDW